MADIRDEQKHGLDGYAETIREMWRHEDAIANHRLTWFNTTQALLFAALALAFKKESDELMKVLVFVGLGSCALTFLSLQLGARAKTELQKHWKRIDLNSEYPGPPVSGYYVSLGSMLGYIAPSNLHPLLFSVAWVIIWFGVF